MSKYLFDLVPPQGEVPQGNQSWLAKRPYAASERTFATDAKRFVAGKALANAINTSIAVGEPLLLTGEPGTGKTQAAYYVAHQLEVDVIHFQVKSDSTAHDLLYHFDTVRYFHEAHVKNLEQQQTGKKVVLNKGDYVDPRPLWQAFDYARKKGVPPVLLIDEIDKAPRDFPNDLLHELDQMQFKVIETDEVISAPKNLRPLVFITSNSERRLPEPFLRRCVYFHIEFNDEVVRKAVENRKDEFENLSPAFLELAIKRFLSLREHNLRKSPATGELLVWLRVLSLATGKYTEQLEEDLAQLPYREVLLKDHQDVEDLEGGII